MILHLLKLVWHRKRSLSLVAAEICCSFLVVFAVVTMAASLISRWRAPLGFQWQGVWVAEVEPDLKEEHSGTLMKRSQPADDSAKHAAALNQMEQLMREVRALPEVEGVAADAMSPYSDNSWETVTSLNGHRVELTADVATDEYAKVMRVKVLRGRWFGPDDEAANYTPIVVDENAARAIFGNTDAVGQKIPGNGEDSNAGETRVVGVIEPYRKDGEFSSNSLNMIFYRAGTKRMAPGPDPVRLVVRVRPGTPAAFQAALDKRLHAVNPKATISIRRMVDMRTTAIKMRLVPIAALAVVAVFLISMVMLGLTGVLWQTVTRRMREIGLRRALGASGSAVRAQVLGEVALLATLAAGAGALIVFQLPLLGIFRVVTAGEFTAGFVASLVVIYGITLLCGAYPSWLASTIDPAEALRYE